MTYRLKDRVLQNHLDAISNGEFSRCLQTELQDIRGSGTTDADYRVFFGFMSGRAELVNRFSMLLYEHEIEAIQEYNSNDWNKFPEVTPPEGVWMRVEQFSNNKVRRTAGIFRDGKWYGKHDVCDTYLDETLGNVTLFRPWE